MIRRSFCLAVLASIVTLAPLAWADRKAEEKAARQVHQLREEKKYKEALALLDELVQQPEYEDSAALRALYRWIYLHELDDPDTAFRHVQELQKLFPDSYEAAYWTAKVHEARGEWRACLDALRAYRMFDKDFGRHIQTATCYFNNGQYDEIQDVRMTTIQALGALGPAAKEALPALKDLKQEGGIIRPLAIEAIDKIEVKKSIWRSSQPSAISFWPRSRRLKADC